MERGHDGRGGMTPSSTSTLGKIWRPAVEESAQLQQPSGRLHEEAWAGRVQSSSLRISREVKIGPGCFVDCVPTFQLLDFATCVTMDVR